MRISLFRHRVCVCVCIFCFCFSSVYIEMKIVFRSTSTYTLFFSCSTYSPISKQTHTFIGICMPCIKTADCFIIHVHHYVIFMIWHQSAIAKMDKLNTVRFWLQFDKIQLNFEWQLNQCICNILTSADLLFIFLLGRQKAFGIKWTCQ